MLKIYYSYVNKKQSHELLFYVLEKFYSIKADESDLRFGSNGKPYLLSNPVYFSITHSFELVMIAVDDSTVGLDVEYLSKTVKDDVVNKFSTEQERKHISSNKDFLCLWTKKESCIKYIGGNVVTDIKKTNFENPKPSYDDSVIDVNSFSGILGDYVYSVTTDKNDFELILVM